MKLSGKRVLVIGLGESGLAMAKWLTRQGALVRVADSRMQPPNTAALREFAPRAELMAGLFAEPVFDGIELIAISPGVPPQEPQIAAAVARGIPLVSEVDLFACAVRENLPESKIVAITGSNGKTTTTALTAYLLNEAGVPAVACGNTSPSVLDALMSALDSGKLPEVWVLELSSFQLETTHSLNADAATLLNVSEDHLDRHAGMGAYVAAKERIFEACKRMVLNRDDAFSLAAARSGSEAASFGLGAPVASCDYGLVEGWIVRGAHRLIACASLKLVGLHNAANAMAALALCEAIGVAPERVLAALAGFSGLAHRVEFVAEINGVSFYDDSKGTNVGATLAAVQGLGRKMAIILGGEGKEQDFSPLRQALAAHACGVALIGRDADLIGAAIEGCGVLTQRCSDLSAAVRWCAQKAGNGEAVLLSPACASYDMFRNYHHRAEAFVAVVRELEKQEKEAADAARA